MSGGTAADSDGIHPHKSNQENIAALHLSKPSSGSAFICCKQCENESSTKRTGDFDKDRNLIDESVLDDIFPNLIGMHTCTAMSNLFSSVFESQHLIHCLCLSAVQMLAASTVHHQIFTRARHSQVRTVIK